mgnify:CR=1 FL=1
MFKRFYTITLDNIRQKYMWAINEADVIRQCAKEYPEATVTHIHLNNRDPRKN